MARICLRFSKRKKPKMSVKIISTRIPEVVIVEPEVFGDSRGFFLETYHAKKYAKQGLSQTFVQDNHSRSMKNILRGLHYQLNQPQAKLVYAATGAVFDVAADIRKRSPFFGQWVGVVLSEENRRQLYIPEGFAHGFCVLSETADFIYKCSDFYAPGDDRGVNWSDSTLNIDWPCSAPLLSDKDKNQPFLKEIPEELLPVYVPV